MKAKLPFFYTKLLVVCSLYEKVITFLLIEANYIFHWSYIVFVLAWWYFHGIHSSIDRWLHTYSAGLHIFA